jgi:flavin reductase (DIM6/NTAB) family NADH-FMN oxidoreductase RutF
MDLETKKHTLRLIVHGLYILTATDGDHIAAAGVSWLSQASFHPPLVMAAIKTDSTTHTLVEKSGAFAVNILAADQQKIASLFFRHTEVENGRINGYAYEPGPQTGAPLFTDLPAWFEARVTDTIKRGDHTVFVAEVVAVGLRDATAKPIVLQDTSWSYGG